MCTQRNTNTLEAQFDALTDAMPAGAYAYCDIDPVLGVVRVGVHLIGDYAHPCTTQVGNTRETYVLRAEAGNLGDALDAAIATVRLVVAETTQAAA